MNKFKVLTLIFAIFATVSACSSSSSTSVTEGPGSTLRALSCDGVRTWDFGASDVLQNATSLISEPPPSVGELGATEFPCTVFWEFSPSFNCSLAFTYENYISTFELEDQIQTVGTSGDNLVVVATDASRVTGVPANISAVDLANLPDCDI